MLRSATKVLLLACGLAVLSLFKQGLSIRAIYSQTNRNNDNNNDDNNADASQQSQFTLQGMLPPVSPQIGNHSDAKGKQALETFFAKYVSSRHGYINVQAMASSTIDIDENNNNDPPYQVKVDQLRQLATNIMNDRKLNCGTPGILSRLTLHNDSIAYTPAPLQDKQRYCFWKNDFVSSESLKEFAFERPLWQWALAQYHRPDIAALSDRLAFLDVGVNVGDWASPMIAAHPNITYFGIEGSPPTAALAAANMLTSAVRRQQSKSQPNNGAAYLFPFPMLTWQTYQQAKKAGGVCFSNNRANVGGQGIHSATLEDCPLIASMAGRAYFPQILRTIAATQPGKSTWPSFFIAKLDIELYEFKMLSSATEWLQRRPPCYVHIEAMPDDTPGHHTPTQALFELLTDAGYNVAWVGLASNHRGETSQFPGNDNPFWDATVTPKVGLVQAWKRNMEGSKTWWYKDYIVGFKDEQACIDRLLREDDEA